MKHTHISGEFRLQNTHDKKVFIATGTGLSPIYNMIKYLGEDIDKVLYFGVRHARDLFYIEELKHIKNLELNIHISKEELSHYNYGRIDFSTMDYPKDTEFYICGNPGVIASARDILIREKSYKKVYFEDYLV